VESAPVRESHDVPAGRNAHGLEGEVRLVDPRRDAVDRRAPAGVGRVGIDQPRAGRGAHLHRRFEVVRREAHDLDATRRRVRRLGVRSRRTGRDADDVANALRRGRRGTGGDHRGACRLWSFEERRTGHHAQLRQRAADAVAHVDPAPLVEQQQPVYA